MRLFYLVSLLSCAISIHSAKPKTNQSTQQTYTQKDTATEQNVKKNRHRHKQKIGVQEPETQKQVLPEVAIQPLFANSVPKEQKRINLFVTKIDFTHEGVSLFLNHTFNNKEYGTEFLPYSLTHLAQFLEFAHSHKQSPEFIEGALRLFNQKCKSAPFITACALERFLDKTSLCCQEELAMANYKMWESFKTTLSSAFRQKFSLAKQDPLGFFEYVSKDLASQVQGQITTPTRVRATLLRFLTHTTDKVIWSPADQEATWHSFKKLGNSFDNLHAQRVIPDELDVNELYWGLVERYCYFLKLAGTQLTLDTCKAIKRDLLGNSLPWMHHKEQEKSLETKMERLMTAVLETEARLHAKDHGIITDVFSPQRA